MRDVVRNKFQMLVDHFKGQENTAKALQVKQPAVSGWVNGTKNMSEKVAIRTQKVTEGKFKAADLCPSLKELEEINSSKN
ncbi:Cro/CI family transcriptional regulator [Acinetobacter guillouiae]|uniref:Cro/CI family transcriptional regulator n=1 Tax=Acinetobacter TaxID=469 RepID=UPI0022E942E2|nr:Cro/CI family transcriptional regulator [Acinetobacter guillouiae]